jgi:IS1 family transposase/transposase-like protein
MHRESLILFGTLLLLLLSLFWIRSSRHSKEVTTPAKPKTPRPLRPRSPDDCSLCCAQTPPAASTDPPPPWNHAKSRRGRRKQIDTEGFACPNLKCRYCGITDAGIHALVGYGSHGKNERIQDIRCQACGCKLTTRRDTPLYRLKTPSQRIGEVLSALAEGLDVAAAVRVFGHAEATIQRWLTRSGMHAQHVHRHLFRNLHLWHIQLDELKTRLRSKSHELWLWVAMDVQTKVIPALALGPRTQFLAHTLIHHLKLALAVGCLPVFSSDGLNLYFYALTAHFGSWCECPGKRALQWVVATGLLYDQVKKLYRQRRVVRVEYRMQWGQIEELKTRLKALGLTGRLNTAFVERVNLTLRQAIAPLIRRTWGTAQTSLGLQTHIEWWRAYYHFIRPHESLRVELARPIERKGRQIPKRYRSRTPAMAAGITHHRWSVIEFLRSCPKTTSHFYNPITMMRNVA